MTKGVLASAQKAHENAVTRARTPASQYNAGNKLRLKLLHIQIDRPSKIFDWIDGVYTVTEVVRSYNYRLNVPRGKHDVST